MLSGWNCDGHKIFQTAITAYPLISNQKIYTIGPGANLDGPRPVNIRNADFIFPTNPLVRRHIRMIDDEEWSRIGVQDIPGAPPYLLYYDHGYDSNGYGQIYLRGQPPAGYQLELYTWQGLKATFTAVTDAVILPDGYEDAIVTNLALRAGSLYPLDAHLGPLAVQEARSALQALMILNVRIPDLRSEAAYQGHSGGYGEGLVMGGGSTTMTYFTMTGAINGTNGSDGNATFTLNATPNSLQVYVNGLLNAPGIDYTLVGSIVTFLAPNIPLAGWTLLATGSSS